MGMRSAIVIGATGLVGASLIRQLCEHEEYVSVTAITRRPLTYEHPKLDVKVKNFETISESDIEFAHEMYCCLGTTIKKAGSREVFEQVDYEYPMQFAALAKNRGIPHFLVISAMGASEKASAYYSRVKGKLEAGLIALDFPRLSIIRPSLLTGNRAEFRLGERAGGAVLKVMNPLLIGPMKHMRSIEANQVALAMLVIALYGKQTKVTVYKSGELAQMKMPIPEEEAPIDREQLFNWDKRKEEEYTDVLDEEVTFNRARYKADDEVVQDEDSDKK